jgi:antibiotic biosynthesis monooxygenase (ABM) superfamily enzyme
MKTWTAAVGLWKQRDLIAASGLAIRTAALSGWKQCGVIVSSSWLAVPISAILALGFIWYFYVIQNYSGSGEPFAWFDGISAWPSIAIILFAAFLSLHFICKTHVDLKRNAGALAEEFRFDNTIPKKTSFFGWETTPSKPAITRSTGLPAKTEERVDIEALWQIYLCRGRFRIRAMRAAPMTILYIAALFAMPPIIGEFPRPPIRGDFPFLFLIFFTTICAFLFLTFFVIDAILLHESFLLQLGKRETCWPDATFRRFEYSITSSRPLNESDLADYWDILLISKRTEAVGRLIYYPFVILSLLIVARLRCFDNWTWSPVVIVVLSMHFSLALYAAWRLPKVARVYRDKVLERLKRRGRQALMLAQRTPEAIDTIIEEVQSTHQGAFSYLWEQPAIRALLLPSSGIGLATLLQFLPH